MRRQIPPAKRKGKRSSEAGPDFRAVAASVVARRVSGRISVGRQSFAALTRLGEKSVVAADIVRFWREATFAPAKILRFRLQAGLRLFAAEVSPSLSRAGPRDHRPDGAQAGVSQPFDRSNARSQPARKADISACVRAGLNVVSTAQFLVMSSRLSQYPTARPAR